MTSLQFGRDPLSVPAVVVPIPKEKLKVVNTNLHHKKEKSLVPVATPRGETMWVHPDIIQSQQWTILTKSKDKAKASSYNVVCASSREAEIDVASLTDSEEEKIILAAKQDAPPMTRTRSGQQYLTMLRRW